MDSAVNPHRTLAIILNKQKNTIPTVIPIK